MNRRAAVQSVLALASSVALFAVSGVHTEAWSDDASEKAEPMVLRVYSDYV